MTSTPPPERERTPSRSHRIVLLGLSGSLRQGSANTALLHTAADLAPDDVEVVVHPLDEVPLFDADLEADGIPPSVASLRQALAEADGLLLASPEYNWSVSGVLKNAIDWLSRGPASPLDHKPTALLSAAGRGGGARGLVHLRDVLGHNQVDVLDLDVRVPRGSMHVADGRLTTPEHRDAVAALVTALRERIEDRTDVGSSDADAA
jgi:chromate reductase, NAD(P)H dehydrogenase (quinone)